MVFQIILADILLIARIFPRPCRAQKNTTQLVKYPHVLSVKPSNKVYILKNISRAFVFNGVHIPKSPLSYSLFHWQIITIEACVASIDYISAGPFS